MTHVLLFMNDEVAAKAVMDHFTHEDPGRSEAEFIHISDRQAAIDYLQQADKRIDIVIAGRYADIPKTHEESTGWPSYKVLEAAANASPDSVRVLLRRAGTLDQEARNAFANVATVSMQVGRDSASIGKPIIAFLKTRVGLSPSSNASVDEQSQSTGADAPNLG